MYKALSYLSEPSRLLAHSYCPVCECACVCVCVHVYACMCVGMCAWWEEVGNVNHNTGRNDCSQC